MTSEIDFIYISTWTDFYALVSVRETANENEIERARENVNGSVNGTFLNSFLYLDFCCTCVVSVGNDCNSYYGFSVYIDSND